MNSKWARQTAVYVSKVTDPWINLAFEDWLFRTQKHAKYQLLLYRNSPCVVFGRNQTWLIKSHSTIIRKCGGRMNRSGLSIAGSELSMDDLIIRAMEAEGVPAIRRRSGGGAVYHASIHFYLLMPVDRLDLGNSNYSITMPRDEFDRAKSAALVSKALHHLDVPSSVNERHDIVVEGRKVSGSAFKLANDRAYHHGTMLISSDVGKLGRFLRGPERGTIVGRGVESVKSPVTCLLDYSYTADHVTFCEAVITEFWKAYSPLSLARSPSLSSPLSEPGDGTVTTLTLDDFYASRDVQEIHNELKSWEWTFGQTHNFVHTVPLTQSTGSDASLRIEVEAGVVQRALLEWDPSSVGNKGPGKAAELTGFAELFAAKGMRFGSSTVDAIERMAQECLR
eukprot:jgi/Hompol1/5734/HPOL_002524-RA